MFVLVSFCICAKLVRFHRTKSSKERRVSEGEGDGKQERAVVAKEGVKKLVRGNEGKMQTGEGEKL